MSLAYLESALQDPPLPITGEKSPLDMDLASMVSQYTRMEQTPQKKSSKWSRMRLRGASASPHSTASTFAATPGSPDSPASPVDEGYALCRAADRYAELKKCFAGEDLDQELRGLAKRTLEALGEPCDGEWTGEEAMGKLAKFVPSYNGNPTSIGSIQHLCDSKQCVGPCRFHCKDKCFDGVLCRFCHLGREQHSRGEGSGGEQPRRRRRSPRGPAPLARLDVPTVIPKVDSGLADLFASLKVAPDAPYMGMPGTMPYCGYDLNGMGVQLFDSRK